jgi:hypothetical protein
MCGGRVVDALLDDAEERIDLVLVDLEHAASIFRVDRAEHAADRGAIPALTAAPIARQPRSAAVPRRATSRSALR